MRTATLLTLALMTLLCTAARADLIRGDQAIVRGADQQRMIDRTVTALNQQPNIVKQLGRPVTAKDLAWDLGHSLSRVQRPTSASRRGVNHVKAWLVLQQTAPYQQTQIRPLPITVPLGTALALPVDVALGVRTAKQRPHDARTSVIGVRAGRAAQSITIRPY